MIAKMKKVKLVCLKEDESNILLNFQKEKIFMPSSRKEFSEKNDLELFSKALDNIKAKAKSFIRKECVVTSDEFLNSYETEKDLANLFLNLNEQKKALLDLKDELSKKLEDLKLWTSLNVRLSDISRFKNITFKLGLLFNEKREFVEKTLAKAGADWHYLGQNQIHTTILIVCLIDKWDDLYKELGKEKFVQNYFLTNNNTPLEESLVLKEKLNEVNNSLKSLEDEIKIVTDKNSTLKLGLDKVLTKMDLLTVDSQKFNYLIYLEGWIPSFEENKFNSILEKLSVPFELELLEPTIDDEVPTLLKNNKLITPFEGITNMFGVPSYWEKDPNALMAFWYFLIFGFMFGDVVYGFILSLFSFLFIKIKKPKKALRDMVFVFGICGISAVIAGVLYGSYLGFTFKPLIFKKDLINEPLKMFYICIGLGLCHIISGLIFKTVALIEKKQIFLALSDGLSWALILSAALILGIKTLFHVEALKYVVYVFFGLGLFLIIGFGGLDKKSVFGKIFGGFTKLTGISSFLGDVLSYSRILALALSSAVIGYVMNLLASMIQVNVAGIILSSFIYLLGHVFNIGMSLLSVYVHDGRLQYIEFFGKFFNGEGYLYEPLQYSLKYVDDVKNIKEELKK